MKDFYDIWLLIQQFDFDFQELKGIIQQVLKNRGTSAEAPPIAFLESFYDNQPRFGSSNATDVLRFGCRRVFGKIGHHQIGETIFFEIRAHSLSSAQMWHFNCRI
jgi:hypothetical protein